MEIKRFIGIMVCLVMALAAEFAVAQTVTSVPPTTQNDRFLDEVFQEMERPGLSVVGFDNGGNYSKGYGLKQILNQVYESGSNEHEELFIKVLAIAQGTIELSPPDADEIKANSNRLQYLAFEALCSFVLEENGMNSSTSSQQYGIPIRDHQTVINEFTNDLMLLVYQDKLTDPGSEYVHYVNTYTNIARAIDLYLALENAYTKWTNHSGNTSWLLTQSEKQQLMERFITDLQKFYDDNVHRVLSELGGIDVGNVNEDEVESGNRPLKGHTALGYSVMAVQDADGYGGVDLRLNSAISKASDYASSSDRTHYWNYQTSNGEKYWAEGPYYFNYALINVVPFWHAIRANGLLGTVSDPFNSSWFLDPVEWLADISTPDGLTPPLDDGNKHRISAAPLLRWSSNYGNTIIGRKFNTIYQRLKTENDAAGTPNKYWLDNTLYLMQLAIPKANSSTSINYDVEGSSDQQMIARHQDNSGGMHYLLLNGEQGNAITRGEGHEQPDQLQLLYYIDDVSYLIDSGYDKPTTDSSFLAWLGGDYWTRSSWNNYHDHNVIRNYYFEPNEFFKGGLEPPHTKPIRIASEHAPVHYLKSSAAGNIKTLSSKVTLNRDLDIAADYERSVLFIKDPSEPYIIDFNEYNTPDGDYEPHKAMTYHGNSLIHSVVNGWFQWEISETEPADNDLFSYFGMVETPSLGYATQPDSTEEYFRDGKDIERLSLASTSGRYFTVLGLFQAKSNAPSHTPAKLVSDSEFSGPNPYQVWFWKQDANTVDVIVKRSKVDMTKYDQDLDFDINGNGFTISSILLPASKDYGFVRLVNTSIGWEIDDDYQINLERGTPTATLSGPGILFEGQEGTWQASATGGVPLYSYTWFLRPEGSSSSSPIGTGSSISYTAYDPFYISVEAEDANSKTDHSPAHYVKITGIYHKTLADSAKVKVPDEFLANPNYPNPFNPTTTIKYGVPEQADVTLNVYNILGQNVATLVNETKAAGYYSVRFDASSLASGFYIARITAEGVSGEYFVDEQKMQLIK